MKVQTIATMYVERNADHSMKARHRRGETFDLEAAEAARAIAHGLVREVGEEGELPPPNFAAADPRPTEPDGTPISEDAEGNPLVAGATDLGDWKTPRSHKAADQELAELGISAPAKAKIGEKAEIIRQYREAQAAAGPGGAAPEPVSTEDISELSDDELIAKGIEAGLSESDFTDGTGDDAEPKLHDEIVLIVAEAVNRRTGGDPTREADLAGSE